MPRYVVIAGLLVFALTSGAAVLFGSGLWPLSEKERHLASIARKKPVLRHTHKLRGPLTLSLEMIGSTPESAGDTFALRGTISSTQDLGSVQFQWAIPKEVEIVSGQTSGQLSNITADQPVTIEITLKSTDVANHQIHLQASSANGGVRFADVAQYNTLLQPLLVESKQKLRAKAFH